VSISAESCRVSLGYWLDHVAAGKDVVVTRRGKPMARLTAAAPTLQPPLVPAQTPQRLSAPTAPPFLSPLAGEAEAG
jgi:prevent-host-death family protein